MGKRKRQDEQNQGANPYGWMLTFSDLITLLITFFVLLLTMSSMDKKKLREIVRHLGGSPGVLTYSDSGAVPTLEDFVKSHRNNEAEVVMDSDILSKLLLPSLKQEGEIKESLEKLSMLLDIRDDERGVVVSFHESILFDSGAVEIKEEAFPLLTTLASAIRNTENEILILGHTDDLPTRQNRIRSNWDLSLMRGLSVLAHFLNAHNLPPSRFVVGGCGSSKPLSVERGKEARAMNRRVEIVFKVGGGI
jgi:chemotaxis protein MotB